MTKNETKMETAKITCAFCYSREQGKNGEIKREWSPEWLQFIPVCRKHAICDGMDNAGKNTIEEVGIANY
jgi:hypothetical protein